MQCRRRSSTVHVLRSEDPTSSGLVESYHVSQSEWSFEPVPFRFSLTLGDCLRMDCCTCYLTTDDCVCFSIFRIFRELGDPNFVLLYWSCSFPVLPGCFSSCFIPSLKPSSRAFSRLLKLLDGHHLL